MCILNLKRRRTRWSAYTIALCVLLVLAYYCFCDLYSETYWVCEHTGSTKTVVTWFGAFTTTSCSKTRLDEFIETRYPGRLTHNWVYVSSFRSSLCSGGYGDSSQPAATLPVLFLYDVFWEDLSDANRKKLYDILVYASGNMNREAKRQLYNDLSNRYGAEFVKFVETYPLRSDNPVQHPSAKGAMGSGRR